MEHQKSITLTKDSKKNCNFGILNTLELSWYHLKIPDAFRLFWVIQILNQVLNLPTNTEINNFTFFEVVKYLIIKGCDTCTAVLGMTSFVSYIFNHILRALFQWVLLIDEVDYGKQSAILFFILAMQSGLTGLDTENRWIKLLENIHLVSLTLQNYIFDTVYQLLINLNGSHSYSRSLNKHSRALTVCGFLIVNGGTTIYYLWSFYHSVSPGLLSVTVMNISLILRVLVSLSVYSLLLINSNLSTFWEDMDDYVFYINFLGIILQYGFGFFILLNDVYDLIFVSGGVIFAFTICFRVCIKVGYERKNWRILMKHYTVGKKIKSLPDATSVQLSELDDVCAICYQKMISAKITRCKHFFHGNCLRQWIYIQDQCPLCKSI
ncbi:protein TRC8 homolog [Myzus persicae]|uniref:protein TRC8 homolog n=1 Tax=Myzus persicae TaxID=13164 RepID=UPI000B934A1B|nr:protein TRC8 homolog [Myzus persicae]